MDRHGRQRFFKGTSNGKETLAIARRFEDEHRLVRLGHLPIPDLPKGKISFKEASEEYLAWGIAQGGRGGHPWGPVHERMREALLKFWELELDLKNLDDLHGTLTQFEKVLRRLQNKGRTGKTIENYADGLASFCVWCKKRGYIATNPLQELSPFDSTPKVTRRALTPDEVTRLLTQCDASRRLLYETAMCTGLRAGELAALRVHHLDTQRRGLQLDASWTKNRKPGFQPVPGPLIDKLAKCAHGKLPEDALLDVPSHPARELDKDLVLAEIPKQTSEGKIDFHALRTAYVTFLMDAGANVKEAQTMARHSTPNLTMNVYARTREARLTEVAERIGDIVCPENSYDTGMTRGDQSDAENERNSNAETGMVEMMKWWRRRESNPIQPIDTKRLTDDKYPTEARQKPNTFNVLDSVTQIPEKPESDTSPTDCQQIPDTVEGRFCGHCVAHLTEIPNEESLQEEHTATTQSPDGDVGLDPDLELLVSRWAYLSQNARDAVLRLVKAGTEAE